MTKRFCANTGPYTLQQIAALINSQIYLANKLVKPDEALIVTDVATLEDATRTELTFYTNPKYSSSYQNQYALACITNEDNLNKAPKDTYILVSKNTYADYARVCALFYPANNAKPGISHNAYISQTASIDSSCEISATAYVGENATIGAGTKIFPGAYIGDNVRIGNNSIIHHNVTINHAIIGDNVILHPGVRIGQDGFGYAFDNFVHVKVPQIGKVIIGNDVEIGANSTIDRGAINDTIIGDMCKIDNLVQIGHNVKLGRGCIVVSQVGISGSTEIGDYSVLGGQVGVAGHIKIGKGVQIAAQSGVVADLADRQIVGGTPAVPIRQWHKQTIMLKKMVETNR